MTDDGLKTLIQKDIRDHDGLISFARFMELALYAPGFGYYAKRDREQVGRSGDFFTSVSVGPLFGRIVARQLTTWGVKQVIEYGGHSGYLRNDILGVLPELDYRIVELGEQAPESFEGCVLSNEFLDALPVHRVRVVQGEWRELFVDADFCEQIGPLSSSRLGEQLKELPVHAMEGFTTEVNLHALDWLTEVSQRLKKGYVLTFDYGYEFTDYFSPSRKNGTLTCYHRHTKNSDPYAQIGEQDITSHVHFTSLMEHGTALGFETVLFQDQGRYLLEIGVEDIRDIVSRDAGKFSRERAAIHQLTHPSMMGRAFNVLILRKR